MNATDVTALKVHHRREGKPMNSEDEYARIVSRGAAQALADLRAQVQALAAENARLKEYEALFRKADDMVEAFQDASGLCVPAEEKGGDPSGVRPEHVRKFIGQLEAERHAAVEEATAVIKNRAEWQGRMLQAVAERDAAVAESAAMRETVTKWWLHMPTSAQAAFNALATTAGSALLEELATLRAIAAAVRKLDEDGETAEDWNAVMDALKAWDDAKGGAM